MIDIHLHSLGPHESVKSLIYFLVNSSCHFDNKDFKVFVVTDPGFSKYAVVRLSYLSTEDIFWDTGEEDELALVAFCPAMSLLDEMAGC